MMDCFDIKYNTPDYWEKTLMTRAVWKGLCAPPDELRSPVFVSTALIDEANRLTDSNWACYPSVGALIGFLQYIYLPTAFYYVLCERPDRLMTPICSADALMAMVEDSQSMHKQAMKGFLRQLRAIWACEESEQRRLIVQFCRQFDGYWQAQDVQLFIGVFFSALEVAETVKQVIWCEEVFEQDTGFTYRQFDALCGRFSGEPFAKHLLMRTLNEKIGCLI